MRKAARPIVQYDLKGNIIQKFPSLYQACKELGIKDGAAYYALNSGSPYGKKWLFKYTDAPKPTVESLGLTPLPVLGQMADKVPIEPEFGSAIDFSDPPEIYDGEKVDTLMDEMYETPDRWMTPYERILARRK